MKRNKKKRILSIAGIDTLKLLGVNDRNIRIIEDFFDERIVVRGDEIILTGSPKHVNELTRVIDRLIRIAGSGREVTEGDVRAVVQGGEEAEKKDETEKTVVYYSASKRKSIAPRSIRQKEYVDAIRDNDILFAIGPAGTGKTYLAIAMALAALKRREIERVFISRPVVEAGENLGFLPGDLQEKIEPYLHPIFDALMEMVGRERVQRMIDSGILEIAPLAYMRGRTLNNAFAILDEAQNSSIMQMKMFLTRLGVNAKAIVTGDITQIDLEDPDRSGLVAVREILQDVEGIKFITFGEEDVVRHRLVKNIIRAFSSIGSRLSRAAHGDETGCDRSAGESSDDILSVTEETDE